MIVINFFKNILYTVFNLVSFLIHTIQSLINLLIKIPDFVLFLTSSVNVLPDVLIPFMLSSIALMVVLFVIGRGTSK